MEGNKKTSNVRLSQNPVIFIVDALAVHKAAASNRVTKVITGKGSGVNSIYGLFLRRSSCPEALVPVYTVK